MAASLASIALLLLWGIDTVKMGGGGQQQPTGETFDVAPAGTGQALFGETGTPYFGPSGSQLGSAIGKGIQSAGSIYAKTIAQGQSQGQVNYQSGSGSPWVGGSKSMSADEPSSYNIPTPNNVTDFQKHYYDLVGQIFQAYQQRVMNEGFGQGQQRQFGM